MEEAKRLALVELHGKGWITVRRDDGQQERIRTDTLRGPFDEVQRAHQERQAHTQHLQAIRLDWERYCARHHVAPGQAASLRFEASVFSGAVASVPFGSVLSLVWMSRSSAEAVKASRPCGFRTERQTYSLPQSRHLAPKTTCLLGLEQYGQITKSAGNADSHSGWAFSHATQTRLAGSGALNIWKKLGRRVSPVMTYLAVALVPRPALSPGLRRRQTKGCVPHRGHFLFSSVPSASTSGLPRCSMHETQDWSGTEGADNDPWQHQASSPHRLPSGRASRSPSWSPPKDLARRLLPCPLNRTRTRSGQGDAVDDAGGKELRRSFAGSPTWRGGVRLPRESATFGGLTTRRSQAGKLPAGGRQ